MLQRIPRSWCRAAALVALIALSAIPALAESQRRSPNAYFEWELWIQPSQILTDNGVYAVAPPSADNVLALYDFRFDIPACATIDGVVLEVDDAWRDGSSGEQLALWLAWGPDDYPRSGRVSHTPSTLSETPTDLHAGTPSYTWGDTDWLADRVNASEFSVWLKPLYGTMGNVYIDSLELTIYYTVEDTTPPTLTVPADTAIACSDSLHPNETGWATAADDCDPDPSISYSDGYGYGGQGFVVRTWRADDASGNSAEAEQRIYIDTPNVSIVGLTPQWITLLPAEVTLRLVVADCAAEGSVHTVPSSWTTAEPIVADGTTVNELTIPVPEGTADDTYSIGMVMLRPADPRLFLPYRPSDWWFGVDLTPPTFDGCPEDIVVDAPPGAAWATVDWAEPIASDATSGIGAVASTHRPGDVFPLGTTTVSYQATDVAGNTVGCSFNVTVDASCDIVTPMGVAGFLDRGWPEDEEPLVVGELPLAAVYVQGELVEGCFLICSLAGEPVTDPVILTLYRVAEIGETFDVRVPLDAQLLRADPETALYGFALETDALETGYHDIRLGYPDGQVQWLRIEVIAPST